MASTFPSVVATLTNPTATQKLNSPSHSTIETNQNTEVIQIQNFIGTESSIVGTLFYDIRAAASNGGGHVQTANKGGTGQTSFNKGDILVASSSSVLTKLAVGTDTQAIVADSTQTSGLNYAAVATGGNIQNQVNTYAVASVLSASVYGITFATAVTSSVAGQAFQVKFPTSNASSVMALSVSSLTARLIKMPDLSNPAVGTIQASMIGIIENDGTNWQLQLSTDTLLSLTDVTTNNVSSVMHGLVPKSPSDSTQYLNGDGKPVFAKVKDSDLSTSDITNNNVSSVVHGFAPKSPADATKFLNGAGTPAYAQVKDSDLSIIDVTTNNASSSQHGFMPKGTGSVTTFYRSDGTQAVPSTKIVISTSMVSGSSENPSVLTLFVASIVGSTIGTKNGIRFSGTIDKLTMPDTTNRIDLQYGVTSIASLTFNAVNGGFTDPYYGVIEGKIVGNGATNDQKGYIMLTATNNRVGGAGVSSILMLYKSGSSSVETTLNQDLIINVKFGDSGNIGASILGTIFTVEKIQ